MKLKTRTVLVAIAVTLGCQAKAQTYETNNVVVETFVGSGFYGYLDGVGQETMFNFPLDLVSNSRSNLFVWDSKNVIIGSTETSLGIMRRIAPDGTVGTFAGGGIQTTGVGTRVLLQGITNRMAVGADDTIWMAIGYGSGTYSYLYRITPSAAITRSVLTGTLRNPGGICIDSLGNVYISDYRDHRIYKNGTIFVGSGNPGYADGNGVFTAFKGPAALAVDPANNVYVWDADNFLIRRIDQNQNVTTFAGTYGSDTNTDGFGTSASFSSIFQMCFDGFGNLILACGTSIRKISAATNVTTLAGSFTQSGYTNGAGNLARFNGVNGVCVSQGMIFVSDSANQRIRSISFNPTSQPVLPADLQLNTYPGLRINGTVGRVYQIESSTDLSNWGPAATVLLTSSPYLWIDQNPATGKRFYRALLLP